MLITAILMSLIVVLSGVGSAECLLSHYQEEISLTKKLNDYLQEQTNVNQVTLVQAASYFFAANRLLFAHCAQKAHAL